MVRCSMALTQIPIRPLSSIESRHPLIPGDLGLSPLGRMPRSEFNLWTTQEGILCARKKCIPSKNHLSISN